MSLLLDTHAVVFFLANSPDLSVNATQAINAALMAGEPLFISTISIAELVYLVDKGRLPPAALASLLSALAQPNSSLKCLAFDLATAARLANIPRSAVPDFPDRLIAATALQHTLTLVTKDEKIRLSTVPTLW